MTDRTARVSVGLGVVAATVAVNAIEFLDFLAYSFFATYIAKAFFPLKDDFSSLLATVAVFGVGFFMRPLGAILIGAYADRAGRRRALLLTIVLITLGTMGLVFTPTYESIGIASPLIVIAFRLLQGFALGGDVGPATAYLIEAAPPERRGLYGSWQYASQGLAITLTGILAMGLTYALPAEAMQSWGWRVPFALGLLIGPVALYLRRAMPETAEINAHGPPSTSLWEVLNARRVIIALSVLTILPATVGNYVGNYMTTYAIKTLGMTPLTSLLATVTQGVAIVAASLLGGWASDRYGRRLIGLVGRAALIIAVYPLFMHLLRERSAGALVIATVGLTALNSFSAGALLAQLPELFPTAVRASGVAVVYAVGVSLFGGTTQFNVTWLLGATGIDSIPALYVLVTSVIGLVAAWMLPETAPRSRETAALP